MLQLNLLLVFHLAVMAAATPLLTVCVEQPEIELVAGSYLDFKLGCTSLSRRVQTKISSIDNPLNATCEGVLTYSDEGFLSQSFIFDPIFCAGIRTARLLVPIGSPNGDAQVSL